MDVIDCYDQQQVLYYVGNATNPSLQDLGDNAEIYTVLKALCIKDKIEYYSERININKANGIFHSNSTDQHNDRQRLYGFDIDAEDPRMVLYHDQIYILFNIKKGNGRVMCISKYDDFQPIELHVDGIEPNFMEKNWSPLVKDDKLYLIYSYDPLVVLHYDFNPDGTCYVVFTQDNITLPVNTTNYIRGGSNLLPYRDGYYIGLCHSRISTRKVNVGGYEFCYYLALAVMIDTDPWKVVYLSKPLMFTIDQPIVKRIGEIIFDETQWMCTSTPTSLNLIGENEYLLTVNINETITLKYKWCPEIDEIRYSYQMNQWNLLARDRSIALIKCASKDATYFLP